VPDFKGIMFHPSWLREDLFMFLLVDRHNLPAMIKNDEAVAGRALI
jgi:hypothetical protein